MSKENTIKNEFKAIYNPYIRKLAVAFGNTITTHSFEDEEEWTKISYNGDEDHPNYLHVQLDYDETFQLLFYPRKDNDSSLHEDLGSYYNSGMKIGDEYYANSENIKLVHSDEEFLYEWDEFLIPETFRLKNE